MRRRTQTLAVTVAALLVAGAGVWVCAAGVGPGDEKNVRAKDKAQNKRHANSVLAEIRIETAFGGVAFFAGSVNGTGPLDFLMDTGGAGSSLKRETAQHLGAKLERGQASVAGDPALEVGVIRSATVQVGATEFAAENVMAAQLAPLEPIFGRLIDGILGGDWMKQFVVELDYERNLMRLYEREGFKYEGQGEALPLAVVHGIPFVDLKVTLPNGKSLWGHFLVDTGGGGMAVHVYRKIAARDGLAAGLKVVDETGRGIGGTTERFAMRGEEVEIGRFKLKRPVVVVTPDEAGLRVDPTSVGLVGMDVLERFTVTFDYSRGRMYLEPNARVRQPFVYNTTGMGLRAAAPEFATFTVSSVRDGSPAKEAGIMRGDALVDLDGRETGGMKLEAIRVALRAAGQTHKITVEREGKKVEVVLKTREMLP